MLIDTNVWAELTRKQPEPRVAAFVAEHLDTAFLSTIVLAEIEYGIVRAAGDARRDRLTTFRADVIWRCADRVLRPDEATAALWGSLKSSLERRGTPVADMDLMIAAQAIAADMPLVTRNASDMKRTGAIIINPWEG